MPAANYNAEVLANRAVNGSVMLMTARWDETTPAPVCGQFYMLRAWKADEAPLLSRPISVHRFDREAKEIEFLYEVKGMGTEKLAALKAGESVQLTGPSGHGFPTDGTLGGTVAVVGGGIGTAPLLQLVRELAEKGVTVDFFAGFRDEPYEMQPYSELCRTVGIATDSGRFGHHGFVTELFDPKAYTAVCTCGPEIMMQKTALMCMRAGTPVYVSKESKMACGVGACLGCTCKTKEGGGVCVCKDGPVFEGSVLYELD